MSPQAPRHARIPLLLLVAALTTAMAAGEEDLTTKCSPEYEKLSDCLPYATAKEDAPSSKCCETVVGIRNRNAVCLCYIMQQSQKSTNAVAVTVQYTRILKLPDACSIQGANASLCPALLKLPPGSPDIAIFNGSARPQTNNFTGANANGNIGRPHIGSVIVAIASAVASSLL